MDSDAGPQDDRDAVEPLAAGLLQANTLMNTWISTANAASGTITAFTVSTNTLRAGPIRVYPDTPPIPVQPTYWSPSPLGPPLPCVCGHRSDGNWEHGEEECTWEG